MKKPMPGFPDVQGPYAPNPPPAAPVSVPLENLLPISIQSDNRGIGSRGGCLDHIAIDQIEREGVRLEVPVTSVEPVPTSNRAILFFRYHAAIRLIPAR